MKDQRVAHFRSTFEGITESLDATSRISRWEGADPIPEPLLQSAAKLVDRLGAASRLANGHLSGPPAVVKRLAGLRAAMQRLDAAYVEFRQHVGGSPSEAAQAIAALDSEIDAAKLDARGQG